MIFLRFYFWLLRTFNDGEPSSQECGWAVSCYYNIMGNSVQICLQFRACGRSLEEIHKVLNIPYERARQLVRKGVRIAWQEYHSQRRSHHQKG